MRISKSNIVSSNRIDIIEGEIHSGNIYNLLLTDFSKIVRSSSSVFTFSVRDLTSLDYIALHGLNVPEGTIITVSGTGFSKSATSYNYPKNFVVYIPETFAGGDVTVTLTGEGSKVISYMQIGATAQISWGTDSGQLFYYLGLTESTRISINDRGLPTNRSTETISPRFNLNIKNALRTWVETELQEIIIHHSDTGILSIIDYEDDEKYFHSAAGFELKTFAPKSHSQTTSLLNVSISMRVSA